MIQFLIAFPPQVQFLGLNCITNMMENLLLILLDILVHIYVAQLFCVKINIISLTLPLTYLSFFFLGGDGEFQTESWFLDYTHVPKIHL